MPRRASRLLLEVTDVRVQRLQEISEADGRAEGCDDQHILAAHPPSEAFRKPTSVEAFRVLWDAINAHRRRGYSWESNPWVWAISFKLIEPAQRNTEAEVLS